MQEPGSPLVPLDPTRLQQQMQQPMRETVARTMSTSSVGSMEGSVIGGHYMEMPAPSTPQFQQQMSPQFSPLPTSQQRFWNPQQSPRPPYQQPAQGFSHMVRMPTVSSQQSQNSQSPRILMGSISQTISPDMSHLSSPSAGQSPMGSPVQPQPPQNLTPGAIQQQQQQSMMYHQQQQGGTLYQQQQQQHLMQTQYQQQVDHSGAMIPGQNQQQFQSQMMSPYSQQVQQQTNQNFVGQQQVVRQQVPPQQQMRMMAPPLPNQAIPQQHGHRVVVAQNVPRFVQAGQQNVQQNVYPGGGQQGNMMYVVQQQQHQQMQQQQRMNIVGSGQQTVSQQYAPPQHPSQSQFASFNQPQQQFNQNPAQPTNIYVQSQSQAQCMPQQQVIMQQGNMRYSAQQVHPGQMSQQQVQLQQQSQQPGQQQGLHFQQAPVRQSHPNQQYHQQYPMQIQQYTIQQQQGSAPASSTQQQQQPNLQPTASNVAFSPSQPQQLPTATSAQSQQHQQQMMYQQQQQSASSGPRQQQHVVGQQQQQATTTPQQSGQFLRQSSTFVGGAIPQQQQQQQQHHVTVVHTNLSGSGQNVQQAEPMRLQYFGHEPSVNANIPPDMCLLGCVFLIVDYDRILDQKEVSDWRTVIVQHGGEVEMSYSSKCTHVICESLRHPVVQQALKETKRCVTAQWLNDCVALKRMQPPWKAVHFPSPFGDNKPCKNRIFSVCGFDTNERSCLKQMIMAVGARYTAYLSKHNTLLIAKCFDGPKVEKAVEWKIPVVNVQWITELFLGQQAVVQNMNNPKYHQFLSKEASQQGNLDLFRIEPSVSPVLVLMTAWRAPVTINADCWKLAADRKQKLEEDYKLFPYKKIKLSPAPDDDEIETNRKETQNTLAPENKPKICFTGLYQVEVDNLTKKALWLSAEIVQEVKECTHLVASDLKRTRKLLESIALGRFIVSPLWIRQSYKQQHFVDCLDYIVKDEGNEKFFGFNVKLSIYRARLKRLFEDMIFYLTPSVQPYPSTLIELIQTSGGTVLQQRPSSFRIAELQQNGVQIVIVTCENDLHLCQHLLELNIAVHSAEFILTGILRQEVDFTSYRIEPKQNENSKPNRESS